MTRWTAVTNKLQTALLKQFGIVILIEKEQFYSERQGRIITMFVLYQRVYDEDKGKYVKTKLLATADQVGLMKYVLQMYKDAKEIAEANE